VAAGIDVCTNQSTKLIEPRRPVRELTERATPFTPAGLARVDSQQMPCHDFERCTGVKLSVDMATVCSQRFGAT
jgi:hypothetical protein